MRVGNCLMNLLSSYLLQINIDLMEDLSSVKNAEKLHLIDLLDVNIKEKHMKKENIEKIYAGKSRMLAVRLFCRICMGFDLKNKKNVSYSLASHRAAKCESKTCPLFNYRI